MTEMQELSDYFQTILKEKKAELAKVKKDNEELKKEINYMYKREEEYVAKFNIVLDCVLEYSTRNNWKTTEDGESCYFCSNGYELAEETLDKLKDIRKAEKPEFKPFSKRLFEKKLADCDKLHQQLTIAVEALEKSAEINKLYLKAKDGAEIEIDVNGSMWSVAREALRQIKELDNA